MNIFTAIFFTITIYTYTVLCEFNKYQSIENSFRDLWKFKFSLLLETFQGRILQGYDYDNNSVEINTAKYGYVFNVTVIYVSTVTVIYNNYSNSVNLKSLCCCDPCNNELVDFEIKSYNTTVMFSCNICGNITVNRVDSPVKSENSSDPLSNKTFISLATNRDGCLDSFTFKDQQITFNKVSNLFLPQCPRRCTRNLCNGGKCQALHTSIEFCDCSNTALNGQFCNKNLKPYNRQSINSFIKLEDGDNIAAKLSWMTNSKATHCLIEFSSLYKNETLVVYQEELFLEKEYLPIIFWKKTNFIKITIKRQYINIQINGQHSNYNIRMIGNVTLNIGFSDSNTKCQTFDGAYEFKFDLSGLDPILEKPGPQICSLNSKWIIIASVVSVLISLSLFLAVLLTKKFINQRTKNEEKRNVSLKMNELYNERNPTQSDLRVYEDIDQNLYDSHVPNLPPRY